MISSFADEPALKIEILFNMEISILSLLNLNEPLAGNLVPVFGLRVEGIVFVIVLK